MQLVKNEKIITIIIRALNLVDKTLIDHGKRVAYRMFKELYPLKIYSDEKLRDILIVGLLHDIGAYKTDDVKSILDFDFESAWDHSVYGYLFFKHFSPLKHLAPVVLFHHAKEEQMKNLSDELKKLILLLKQADHDDINFCICGDLACLDCAGMDSDVDFVRILRHTDFSEEHIDAYLHMIVFSIDFRSPQTMLHTFAAAHVAVELAKIAGLSDGQIKGLETAAKLHDIGKMGMPLNILEGTSSTLSNSDMEIMKSHVALSEEILTGCLRDDILNIAINHHEKLNGEGYMKKLDGSQLAYLDRLMAVADTFSAMCVSRSYQKALSKERILEILDKIKNQVLLDGSLIDLAINNFDEITQSLEIRAQSVIEAYEVIAEESRRIHEKILAGDFNIL